MVATIRNEERFLEAHLRYHRALGIERVYLFLDRCDDASASIAARFPWVERFEIENGFEFHYASHLHTECMDLACDLAREAGCDWMLGIDPDEFAFGSQTAALSAESNGAELIEAGSLVRLVESVDPGIQLVRLPTWELLPGPRETPFWEQDRFQREPGRVEREIYHPLTGETRRWQDFLGHHEGKCLVRLSEDVQAYDSHRWVWNQECPPPHRPSFVPLATEKRGLHFHFLLTGPTHWREKYRKFSHVPSTWPCGTAVEFPKQTWKEAASTLDSDEAANYYSRWIALDPRDEARLLSDGDLVRCRTVEKILLAVGFPGPDSSEAEPGMPAPPTPVRFGAATVREDTSPKFEYPLGKVSPDNLRGFDPVEVLSGSLFRWSQPSSAVRVRLPPANHGYEAELDFGTTWPLVVSPFEARINDQRHEVAAPTGPRVSFPVSRDCLGERDSDIWLEFRFAPLDTSHWQTADPRNLGAAIFGLRFSPVVDP